MSDNWITLIPESPNMIPDKKCQLAAQKRFQEIATDADEIKIKIFDKCSFFDCGSNFQKIRCPSCKSEIAIEWWNGKIDEDYVNDGFELNTYQTPCCKSSHTLHDLIYDWPQGFGRFAIEAMNPNIGELKNEIKEDLENLLRTKIRVIYQHI